MDLSLPNGDEKLESMRRRPIELSNPHPAHQEYGRRRDDRTRHDSDKIGREWRVGSNGIVFGGGTYKVVYIIMDWID